MKQVKQIIPATGWSAIYEKDDGSLFVQPLCCWAVVEERKVNALTYTRVVGMDTSDMVKACDEATNFLGYIGPGEDQYKYVRKDS